MPKHIFHRRQNGIFGAHTPFDKVPIHGHHSLCRLPSQCARRFDILRTRNFLGRSLLCTTNTKQCANPSKNFQLCCLCALYIQLKMEMFVRRQSLVNRVLHLFFSLVWLSCFCAQQAHLCVGPNNAPFMTVHKNHLRLPRTNSIAQSFVRQTRCLVRLLGGFNRC